ncbi:MAG TPA: alanine dehydrogenase [Planctomycetota bacterium]
MILGIPKEIKKSEYRVALTPSGARAFVRAGHAVLVESEAGAGSGFADADYQAAGATIMAAADPLWKQAEMILKVKEPQAVEIARARAGQTIFTYFHFAADRELTEGMAASGAHCFAYETLVDHGTLPLLTPMSEVAGRMAVQEGAKYLERPFGGRGVLLSGIPGVEPGHVMVLGGGIVGSNAALIAAGMGARVTILDINIERLRELEDVMPANVTTVYSSPEAIRERLPCTDLLIGAVLVTGARAPRLVRREDLALMPQGSVIVDVAVDQGGCVETCRATTHDDPVFVIDGVVHYCVANMPGAVARTSTFGLTNATLPYALRLAALGPRRAVLEDDALASAANTLAGEITHGGVADAFDMPCREARTAAAALQG